MISQLIARNDLPVVSLVSPDGARAEVYLHGAHVTSWIPSGGTQRLFLSERSDFGGSAAIRGGIPVIFPQFAARGPLPKHGFARASDWELVNFDAQHGRATQGRATLRFSSSAATRAIWPGEFIAELRVSVSGQ